MGHAGVKKFDSIPSTTTPLPLMLPRRRLLSASMPVHTQFIARIWPLYSSAPFLLLGFLGALKHDLQHSTIFPFAFSDGDLL